MFFLWLFQEFFFVLICGFGGIYPVWHSLNFWISGLVFDLSLGKSLVIIASNTSSVPLSPSWHSHCTYYVFVVVPWSLDILICFFLFLSLFSLLFGFGGFCWHVLKLSESSQRPLVIAALMSAGFLLSLCSCPVLSCFSLFHFSLPFVVFNQALAMILLSPS